MTLAPPHAATAEEVGIVLDRSTNSTSASIEIRT